ncbi:hypothetical protein DSL72_000644 [Monilinia vaccinii-corymbosi]|uniref:Uncharacterized protein n=1 Tax=Monilinia vaccinii-corymbosi TaxID=61207 RepID=A0A8A3NZX1_9HELO|nr:hypothetical protein DSL72_000644 [Monilinia vaccinii-corymbosi]
MPTYASNDSNNSTPSMAKESSSGSTKKQRQQENVAHTCAMLAAKKAKDKALVEDDFSLRQEKNFDSKGKKPDKEGLPIDSTTCIHVLEANPQTLRAAESTQQGPGQVDHQQQQQQQRQVDSKGSLHVMQASQQESKDNIFESSGRRLFGSPAKRQFEAEDCCKDLESVALRLQLKCKFSKNVLRGILAEEETERVQQMHQKELERYQARERLDREEGQARAPQEAALELRLKAEAQRAAFRLWWMVFFVSFLFAVLVLWLGRVARVNHPVFTSEIPSFLVPRR